MLINVHIVIYVAQRVPCKKMTIKIKPGKLLTTGDLGQLPVKNNVPNKFCYNCEILLDYIFIAWFK